MRRTIPNIANLLKRLDDVITKELIPAVTGGIKCLSNEKKQMSLPAKLGVTIPIFWEIAEFENSNSRLITVTLTIKVSNQERRYEQDPSIKEINSEITRLLEEYCTM